MISVSDVSGSVGRQKRGKAPGPDGIRMEAFIFAGHRLHVFLSILFDMFIKCSYVPSVFFVNPLLCLLSNVKLEILQMLIITEQLLSLMLFKKFLSTSSMISLLMKMQ